MLLPKNISSRRPDSISCLYHVPWSTWNLPSLSEWALPLTILNCLRILTLMHTRSTNNNNLSSQHLPLWRPGPLNASAFKRSTFNHPTTTTIVAHITLVATLLPTHISLPLLAIDLVSSLPLPPLASQILKSPTSAINITTHKINTTLSLADVTRLG